MSYVDPHFRQMPRPGAGQHGRQIGRRDKLMAIAFGALLLFGVWWLLLRPDSGSYTVFDVDVYGSFGWTSRERPPTHTEIRGFLRGNPISVFVGPHTVREVILELSTREQIKMRLENSDYPDADRKIFANAVVVCGIPDDCKTVARSITGEAKDREAEYRANTRNTQ